MSDFFNTFTEKFILDFIEKDRWKFITGGLKITLIVTFFALVFGILIGMIVAIIRSAHDLQDKNRVKGVGSALLSAANAVCKLYVTEQASFVI